MLNDDQYAQLLKPLNPARVAKRSQAGRSLSYLEAWDVKAHLNRIFGFLNWSADVTESSLAFEDQNEKGQWNVGYKVTLRLTIHPPTRDSALGWGSASYTECAVGSASLPQRGEAHDMAVKSAESDALKRAAINLGTQFGLSLYDNGSLKDVIGRTLDREPLGQATQPETRQDVALPDSPASEEWMEQIKEAAASKDIDALLRLKKEMNESNASELLYQQITLAKWIDRAIASIGKADK